MSDTQFSKLVRDSKMKYNNKQAFLKLPPIITFGYQYTDIDFNLLVKIPCRTDDNCSHYVLNDTIFSLCASTNTWTDKIITPFFEQYTKTNGTGKLKNEANTIPNKHKQINMSRIFNQNSAVLYATTGDLVNLVQSHKLGCPWSSMVCFSAAKHGQINCLKYAHENGCNWTIETCNAAASSGHVDCLAYAHENGCEWTGQTMDCAAMYGQLNTLKYLAEHGCPISVDACEFATVMGNIDCLRYLHECGYPWDEHTCATAAANGQLECLVYLHEHGCPWDHKTIDLARSNDEYTCLAYALQHCCSMI